MELGERVDHIKPVHVNYGGVDDELRAGGESRKKNTAKHFVELNVV